MSRIKDLLYAVGRTIKHYNDKQFLNLIKSYNINPNVVHFDVNDNYTINKPLAFINIDDVDGIGFFSIIRILLLKLEILDFYGLPCYINVCGNKIYANIDENLFDKYFKQPFDLKSTCINEYRYIFKCNRQTPAFHLDTYDDFDDDIRIFSRLFKKYFALRKDIEDSINESMKNLLGNKRILGVHIRGGDFKTNPCGHPGYVETHEYLNEVMKLLDKHKYDVVFLATDDNEAVKIFKEALGEKCKCYSAKRSDDSRGVHFLEKLDGDDLAYDVLKDVYTLANCDGLIAGKSQVSLAARYINEALFDKYEDVIILDKGITRHG